MNDIRNIQTIAPFLADDFVDLDESIFDTEEYSRFLNQNSDLLGFFKKYSFCKLHDSWIIWIKNNKNYMSIGVSVRTTKFAARNNGIGVRQESNPQSPTAYSSVRYFRT
jgi:hypothetical protein